MVNPYPANVKNILSSY